MKRAAPEDTPRKVFSTLERAAAVFVHGFGFTRSFTHPYLAARMGPLWVMRDAPRKKPGDYRREEWIACEVAPSEVNRLARAGTRGRYCICALRPVGVDDAELRAAYKALGYRLAAAEPVMVHPLKTIPRAQSPATIRRVLTQDLADALAKVAESRQILPEHLVQAAPLRQYVALIDGEIVGWVRSIVGEAGNWCSNMFVRPKHRRKGIGAALLAQMLRDDRSHGAACGVLTASHTGAKLYVTAGYRQVGTLLLFNPKK
ncbi:MAG: GNAT family N-acetyltransferase [Opitutaceae bacterium]|nr:GNAT family N-acetyltransferase [Opitutaceae bacterium]MBP9911991.1 GNAT family N-acetyltransferase [Opitutaceae bacterium]